MPATISASGASASAPLGSSSSVDRATASTIPRSAARAASLPHPSSIAVARAATIADARATHGTPAVMRSVDIGANPRCECGVFALENIPCGCMLIVCEELPAGESASASRHCRVLEVAV